MHFVDQRCSLADAVRPTAGRMAFTLLELLLVLTVLAVIAMLGSLRLFGFLQQHTVTATAEQVRELLDHARVRAVEEGRTLQFRYEPYGSHYVLLPQEPVDPNRPSTATSARPMNATHEEPYRIFELSPGCSFHVDNALLSGEPVVLEKLSEGCEAHLENGLAAGDVAWSAPILFFPNGAATDGLMTIIDPQKRYIEVSVRGLTGTVNVAKLAVLDGPLGTTGN